MKIVVDKSVLEQALEALEKYNGALTHFNEIIDYAPAITALRAALAQQDKQVEPVATLTAQRDALLEALKQSLEEAIYPSERLSDVYEKARAAIKAVEEIGRME